MKKILLSLLVFAAVQQVHAQSMQTLVSKKEGKSKIGAYGMPAVKFTPVDGNFGVITGLQGGVILNRKLMLGIAGYSTVNNIDVPSSIPDHNNQSWHLWYSGFVAEYIHNTDKLVHWTAGTLIGGGGVFRREKFNDHWDDDYRDRTHDYSGFFAAEPFANLEVNITTFMRLDIGASYRFVLGSSTAGITDAKLSGPAVHVGIKAGKF